MKMKLLSVIALVFVLQAASIGRTKTLSMDNFWNSSGNAFVIKKRFVSDLQIKKSTAEFVYLQSYPDDQKGNVYHHFKRQNLKNYFERDFFINLEDVAPGKYVVHARACYQMWEVFIEIR